MSPGQLLLPVQRLAGAASSGNPSPCLADLGFPKHLLQAALPTGCLLVSSKAMSSVGRAASLQLPREASTRTCPLNVSLPECQLIVPPQCLEQPGQCRRAEETLTTWMYEPTEKKEARPGPQSSSLLAQGSRSQEPLAASTGCVFCWIHCKMKATTEHSSRGAPCLTAQVAGWGGLSQDRLVGSQVDCASLEQAEGLREGLGPRYHAPWPPHPQLLSSRSSSPSLVGGRQRIFAWEVAPVYPHLGVSLQTHRDTRGTNRDRRRHALPLFIDRDPDRANTAEISRDRTDRRDRRTDTDFQAHRDAGTARGDARTSRSRELGGAAATPPRPLPGLLRATSSPHAHRKSPRRPLLLAWGPGALGRSWRTRGRASGRAD